MLATKPANNVIESIIDQTLGDHEAAEQAFDLLAQVEHLSMMDLHQLLYVCVEKSRETQGVEAIFSAAWSAVIERIGMAEVWDRSLNKGHN